LGVGVVEKRLQAPVPLVRCEGGKFVLEGILNETAIVVDLVGSPQFVDVIAQEADHQVEDFLVLGEHDVRADVVVQSGKGIRSGEPARRAFLFQDVDRLDTRVFLQEVSQRQRAQAAAEKSISHFLFQG
jgi:hypothetical protein